MDVQQIKPKTNVALVVSRNAVMTGLVLITLAVALLGALAVRRVDSADLIAAFAFAAGYLLHAGVSLIRRVF